MTQAVEVDELSVIYQGRNGPVAAVKDVSFAVPASSFLCILGPSGCGKSTILNCLAGFLAPSSGRILIGGRPANEGGYVKGIVFQDLSQLFPWRTARGNVEFGLEIHTNVVRDRQKRALELLRLVKLEKFADSYPHQLSGGMQQRVAIARALAYNPDVLLMDEPFAALDAMTRDEMQEQLAEIWQETRKTIIYITHNVSEAVFLGEEVIVMSSQGTVQARRTIDLPRPRDPLSVQFTDLQKEILGHLRPKKPDIIGMGAPT
jgi:NitT/TauT family transport system ATP-binding protein